MKNSILKLIAIVLLLASCSKDDNSPEQKVVLSSDKQFTSFIFSAADNAALAQDVVATINEEAKAITATLSSGADLAALTPTLAVSNKASVSPTIAQDFTNPVTYVVTAEDGTKASYMATVTKLLTQKEILQLIVDANPNNTLGWDLTNTADLDLGTLDGVTTDVEGKIIELYLFNEILNEIPAEIGLLNKLTFLLIAKNEITTVPIEIGNLVNLEKLILQQNKITIIPSEIGNLENLEVLDFYDNNLTAMPPEIGNLTKLTFLGLSKNNLNTVPSEIGNLVKLEVLSLSGNSLTTFPTEVSNLVNLKNLELTENDFTTVPIEVCNIINLEEFSLVRNSIALVPSEISNLVNLKILNLHGNVLTSVPSEIGFLTSLLSFVITENNLTSIPQAVCNLETFNGLTIHKDVNVSCKITSPKDALISIYSANPNNTLDWGVNNFSGVTFDSQRSIIELDLRGRGIERIESNVATFESLEVLDVRDNTIESIHVEVCDLVRASVLVLRIDFGQGCVI